MLLAAVAAAAAIAGPFYADPDSNAERQADAYEQDGRTADAEVMRRLSKVPQAFWFTSGSPKTVRKDVDQTVDSAARAHKVPVLVAYNVPNRDCGSYSAGGAKSYKRWVNGFAQGVGKRKAVIILEPDALAAGCGKHRYARIRSAVTRLAKLEKASVYVDAGHSNWQPTATMAARLKRTAIDKADGFALNVSNFRATEEVVEYGTKLSNQLNEKPFVIDTSRNGQGPAPPGPEDWCNPPGRGLGAKPTRKTGNALVDAYLWIKTPGESDGECADGSKPPAGHWWPEYALGLADRANPPL